MSTYDAKQDVVAALEVLVDKHGLTHVLTGLSLMCSEKADHLRSAWQDKSLAHAWDSEALRIEKCARSVRV